MSTAMAARHDHDVPPPTYGAFGRLGLAMADHSRWVVGLWLVLTVGLGAAAPTVFSSLAGAGWQASGSESVAVRDLAQRHFGGASSSAVQLVVHTGRGTVSDPDVQRVLSAATAIFAGDPRFAAVVPPRPGTTISRDGHTAVLTAGAAADPDEMVRAMDDHADALTALSTASVQVYPTGETALWSDFNAANHHAMIKAELFSWPVTLMIMVLAFGSLVAAGLPLLLTLAGLVASAGALVLLDHAAPISVWAMNFALMFALALGIDYSLFVVSRFRAALGRTGDPRQAVAEAMGTAGRAAALSGATVLVSLSAVLVVPAPAVRTMAVGIMLSVVFVLAATLTILPAVLARLGRHVDAAALPWATAGEQRSARFAAWGALLHRRAAPVALASVLALGALAVPVLHLRVAMPSIAVVPADSAVRQGYDVVQAAFGEGAPGALQVITTTATAEATASRLAAAPGIAAVTPPVSATDGSGLVALQAVPTVDPSDPALAAVVERLRDELPRPALVGGASAEYLDLQSALNTYLPRVVAIILVLGFLLLLFALQAPLAALLGVLVSLLSTGAAFGVAKLVFQDGHGSGLLGFTAQGFLDGWAPVFFFAMIFAIAMDYTVFLLSSAKEQHDRTGDPRTAQVEGLASSGRVIAAAAAVMVAVFFSFALAEPLPPKEMGIVLGVAVLLDAAVVRLVLLPALLSLCGRAAWWTPAWLSRLPAGGPAVSRAWSAGLDDRPQRPVEEAG